VATPSYKITWTVGLLFRGTVRRAFLRDGVRFTEDKGPLDSQFIIWPTSRAQYDALMAWTRRVSETA
jgi:hypothetical protein